MADTNGALLMSLQAFGGKKSEMKLYSEMVRRVKPHVTDTMTGREIVGYIAGKL